MTSGVAGGRSANAGGRVTGFHERLGRMATSGPARLTPRIIAFLVCGVGGQSQKSIDHKTG